MQNDSTAPEWRRRPLSQEAKLESLGGSAPLLWELATRPSLPTREHLQIRNTP